MIIMIKRKYENHHFAKSHIREFHNFQSSHIKSMREDFNDMFYAEYNARLAAGDFSLVFVLTYNDEHVFSKFGRNLLYSPHLKCIAKSSKFAKFLERAYGYRFDCVLVGEYGNGGVTHNHFSKRGVGNNPHFHGTGWFHKIAEPDPEKIHKGLTKRGLVAIENLPLKEQLYLLLRFAWQGCIEDNIYIYAASPYMRSLGYGHVDLDGEIQTCHGSSYISKYMGKDVGKIFISFLRSAFQTTIVRLLKYQCYDPSCNLTFEQLLWLWYQQGIKGKYKYYNIFKSLPIEKPLKEASFAKVFTLHDTLENMDILFEDKLTELLGEYNTTYSPKLRKFQGFGYSLIEDADLTTATYNITKSEGSVSRCLPPSVLRHFFYDYTVCINSNLEKIVKYTPNKYGCDLIESRLRIALFNGKLLIRAHGSDELKAQADKVLRFAHCVVNYDLHINTQDAVHGFEVVYHDAILPALQSDESAICYSISCHDVEKPYSYIVFCDRPCYDVLKVMNHFDHHFVVLYKEYLGIKRKYLQTKDDNDADFLAKCKEIYKLSY